jgi:hypothetical protein
MIQKIHCSEMSEVDMVYQCADVYHLLTDDGGFQQPLLRLDVFWLGVSKADCPLHPPLLCSN